MAVKSAMMTTASQTDNAGKPIAGPTGGDATPLNFGSGHVTPASAFDPGLVYDSGLTDWVRYGCGIRQFQPVFGQAVCDSFGSIDPSDLNYPTIAIGDLAGAQTVTRTVTNVSTDDAGIYDVKVSAPAGTTVTVTPTHLVVPPGKSKSFTVKVTRTTARLGSWAFGSLTWIEAKGKTSPHNHSVRSNIAVRPVAAAAPSEISVSGTTGTSAVSVMPGYTGTLTATPNGLAADTQTAVSLTGTNTNFNPAAPAAGPAVAKVTVNVPAGTRLTRFATFDADYAAGADIDLFIYNAGTSTLARPECGRHCRGVRRRPSCGQLRHLCRGVRTAGRRKRCLHGARTLVHRPVRGEQPDGDTGIAVGDLGSAGDGDDRLEWPHRRNPLPRRGRLRRRYEHDRLHDRGGDSLRHTAAATRPPTQHETAGGRDSGAHRFRHLRSKNRLVSHFRLTVPAVARTLSRTHY